ncbi:hypothetical protein GCM10009801_21530 [Streptomyces albiaxialis]|uniref:DUF4184 domain-containing protein n=1 Tax=Streptomyces albiaxialis TaxID=329523 RepID=A0ABN2VTW8_9ACTN
MLGWAVAHGTFATACALTGTRLFPGGAEWPDWLAAATAAAGGGAALATVRARPVRDADVRGGPVRPFVRGLLWTACVLSAVSAFSLLMDVLGLLFLQGVDSPARAAHHALGAVGAVLLAATARSARGGGPGGPGGPGGSGGVPRVTSPEAPRRVRYAAYAGALAFVPYAAMKLTWALDGTFAGVSGAEMRERSERNGASGLWLALESWGLDGTVLLAALGVFLLLGLVRPWGRVFPRWVPLPALRGRPVPRWLPLTPALLGAATLAPYGVIGTGYLALCSAGALEMRRGDFPTPRDALLVSWIGVGAFALYGLALALAARSYWLRTGRTAGPRIRM